MNDWAGESLKGSPTQVESDTYKIDSTGKLGPLDEKTIEKFDSSGYTISVVTSNGKDSIKTPMSFVHEADGTKTTISTYTYDGWDSHGNWTQQTSLNEKGKPTKVIMRIILYKD